MAHKGSENLKPFTSENQPVGRRSRKGIPNRATVYKRILEMKTKVKDGNDKEITLSMHEAMALGQAKSAMAGNTSAWVEIQNSIYGKQTDKVEHSADFERLKSEIIDRLVSEHGFTAEEAARFAPPENISELVQ